MRLAQWGLFAVAVAGALWLTGLFALDYLQMPEPDTPDWRGLPVPTVLFAGGVLAGIVLALLSRLLASFSAKRRAAAVERKLRSAIADVVQEYVVDPIQTEIGAYRACRDGIASAVKR